MRLAIIANPISGGGRAYGRIERLCRAWPHLDWTVTLSATRCAGHAGALALELLDEPPDLLAVCGGDGTLNEVISSLPQPPFPISLIPGGTANVLAREIGLSMDPEIALESALKGDVRYVDLGLLQGRIERRFLLMSGIGADAYVVASIRPKRRRFGIAAFYRAGLRAMFTYRFPEFFVHLPDETLPARSCLAANARSYGGGLVFTPEADMQDGLLDILVLQGKPGFDYFRFLFSAWLGKPRLFSCVQRRRAAALKVEGFKGVWVQADGELFGSLPVEVHLAASAFPLVVPKLRSFGSSH